MEDTSMDTLFVSYYRKVEGVSTSLHRYLYSKINWDNHVIGIKGARGVGKTTLILQHIKESFPERDKALYVSLDNLWFSIHSLVELVEYFYTHGGTHIFLDEVHRYPKWQTVLKNICDDYPTLHIVYTGSSMLEIDYNQGDMSRRQVVYTLNGLSFREFLEFEGALHIDPLSIADLLDNHNRIAAGIAAQTKVLPYFEKYLVYGYYPFYREMGDGFQFRLQETVNQVLNSDLPAVEDFSFNTISKMRKMLMMLAERIPHIPKMVELYKALETTRDQGLKMLYILEKAQLVSLVGFQPRNYIAINKPDKILMNNPNLMYSLTSSADKGSIRESFFHNQVSQVAEVLLSNTGDFFVDRKYTFEVGGKSKTYDQIMGLPNAYLAVDGIEIGHHARIPLWMFGMLY
ncbi:MAG: AAA family ATPase [Bacteroidales bacterium]|nr:AAA family ATPase [Bacteroidales bacterium]